ncbi:unnamed protein product [Boreogadus saida]
MTQVRGRLRGPHAAPPHSVLLPPSAVPKKLLQEPGPSAPVDPLSPGAHDPNVVGDSAPPQGTVVRPSDTVPERKRVRESGSYPVEEKSPGAGPGGAVVGRGGGEGGESVGGIGGGGGGGPPQGPDMHPLINSTSGPSMTLVSDALAAYTFIADHPERGALFFVCGVCLGLLLTLFALVVQISCRTDCPSRPRPPHGSGSAGGGGGKKKKRARLAAASTDDDDDDDDDSSDSDSEWDTASDVSARRRRRFERTLNTNVFTSAEELERAQRLEERERIIREIWMNGQPDVPGTRSLNRYY